MQLKSFEHSSLRVENMDTHRVGSIGTIKVVTNEIALWQADEGIVIDRKALQKLVSVLERLYPNGVKLILDKRNSYSVDGEAMFDAGNIVLIKATAIVAYTMAGKFASESQIMAVKYVADPPVRLFTGQQGVDAAINWLEELKTEGSVN